MVRPQPETTLPHGCRWRSGDDRPGWSPGADRQQELDAAPSFRKKIAQDLAESEQTGLALLAIESKLHGRFVGYGGLIIGNATLDEPEIPYELFQREHGNGYATEASRAILSAAQDTGRTRLWATVREWNLASFRDSEKIGFVDSGRVDRDPGRGDCIWMTWRARRM
ncbi:MAG: GNAT family N-acetyltransferase [Specibacter sp.]